MGKCRLHPCTAWRLFIQLPAQRFQTTNKPHNWTRFLPLPRHVRALKYHDDSMDVVFRDSVLDIVLDTLPASTIFPSLRHLDVSLYNTIWCSRIEALFLVATIKHLVFCTEPDPSMYPEFIPDFFQSAAQNCEIQSLSIVNSFLSVPPLKLTKLLQEFDRLNSLTFDAASIDMGNMLEHIRHFPKLTTLNISAKRMWKRRTEPLPLHPIGPKPVLDSVTLLQLVRFDLLDQYHSSYIFGFRTHCRLASSP
jgi:hypothetical protein